MENSLPDTHLFTENGMCLPRTGFSSDILRILLYSSLSSSQSQSHRSRLTLPAHLRPAQQSLPNDDSMDFFSSVSPFFLLQQLLLLLLLLLLPMPSLSSPNRAGLSSSSVSDFLNQAKRPELVEWMVGLRRRLHEHPELGFEEFETSKLIRKGLDEMGIPYKHPVAVTGVVGFVGTGNPPFVALRADMDALPIQEAVEWEHKSKIPGKMHACGHDAHVAMLLGAAKLLQEQHEKLQHAHTKLAVEAVTSTSPSGTVVLVFQPAEEGGAGAKKMIETGVLENVGAIFGLHVSSDVPFGMVASRPGPILAGSGSFEAVISGKGGHAALPQHTIDPILAASNVIVSLQHLISREADPLDSQVLTIAKFQGGGAFNVIPDSVTIGGTFRAFSRESFSRLKDRIEEVIIGQAAVQRCNATVDFLAEDRPFFPVTVNEENLHSFFLNVAGDMLGSRKVREMQPLMGSEDFAFYSEVMPGCLSFLGMRNESGVVEAGGHSPFFRVNEAVLPYGAALHAAFATSYLLQQSHHPSLKSSQETAHHDEL
ncbi:IAA-amino acid hydrolase ILR1-like 4 [Asimina triloba]